MHVPPINAGSAAAAASTATTYQAGGTQSSTFGQMVADLVEQSNSQQVNADQTLQQLITGESDSVHGVVLAMAKADMSFRLLLEIRNRLIESYQEIMRMQV